MWIFHIFWTFLHKNGGCNGCHCHLTFLSMLYFCLPACVSRSLLSISCFVFFSYFTSSISHSPFHSLFLSYPLSWACVVQYISGLVPPSALFSFTSHLLAGPFWLLASTASLLAYRSASPLLNDHPVYLNVLKVPLVFTLEGFYCKM